MARQKQVYDSDMVAHLWANQSQESARNAQGNIYFDGRAIYSYGRHYCIARFAETKGQSYLTCPILYNKRPYSTTTAKHCSYVWLAMSAIQRERVICVDNPGATSLNEHAQNFQALATDYRQLLTQASKARGRKAELLREAEALRQSANRYRSLFLIGRGTGNYGRQNPAIAPLADLDATLAAYKAADDKANAKRRAAQEEAERKEAEREAAELAHWFAVGLPAWKRGENQWPCAAINGYGMERHIPYSAPVDFRLIVDNDGYETDPPSVKRPETIQTTKGAEFPRSHCERVFRAVLACRLAGQSWSSNGRTIRIGHFQLDSIDAEGNVVAGCHNVRWQEIEAFARELGILWGTPAPEAGRPIGTVDSEIDALQSLQATEAGNVYHYTLLSRVER